MCIMISERIFKFNNNKKVSKCYFYLTILTTILQQKYGTFTGIHRLALEYLMKCSNELQKHYAGPLAILPSILHTKSQNIPKPLHSTWYRKICLFLCDKWTKSFTTSPFYNIFNGVQNFKVIIDISLEGYVTINFFMISIPVYNKLTNPLRK